MYQTISNIHSQVQFTREIEYFKSPPCYYNQLPTINCVYNTIDHKDDHYCDIWTDGSCIPNPGPGGGGIHFPQHPNLSTTWTASEETTINYCELKAIEIALDIFKSNQLFNIYNTCNIYTDSLFCFNIFKGESYPNYYLYYKDIINIIDQINYIQQNKCLINFIKVRSHTDIDNNDKADELAKQAAELAIEWKDNKSNNYNERISTLVDIHKSLTKWNKRLHQDQQKSYQRSIINHNNQESSFKTKENIFSQGLFNSNNKFIYNKQYFKEELKFLTKETIEIINKLRTEHINLNNYKYQFHDLESPLCDKCQVIENVSHILFDCNNYHHQRYKWYINLSQINQFFNNPVNRTSLNVLFPFRWQPTIDIKDPNYKTIYNNHMQQRFDIYESIITFIKDIKYFENQY